MSRTPWHESTLIWLLLCELSLGLIALIWSLFLTDPLNRSWDWSLPTWGLGSLATLPLLVMFALINWLPFACCRNLRQLIETTVRPIFTGFTWWQLLLVASAAGWGEELLFRGVLQPLAIDWLGEGAGLVVISLLFGAAHALSRMYFALTCLMSLYLGWLLQQTGNLALVIIVHGLYDAIALWCFLLQKTPPVAE